MPAEQKPEIRAAVKIPAVLRAEVCVRLSRRTPAGTKSRRRHDSSGAAARGIQPLLLPIRGLIEKRILNSFGNCRMEEPSPLSGWCWGPEPGEGCADSSWEGKRGASGFV